MPGMHRNRNYAEEERKKIFQLRLRLQKIILSYIASAMLIWQGHLYIITVNPPSQKTRNNLTFSKTIPPQGGRLLFLPSILQV
jgi:hypothetical protein